MIDRLGSYQMRSPCYTANPPLYWHRIPTCNRPRQADLELGTPKTRSLLDCLLMRLSRTHHVRHYRAKQDHSIYDEHGDLVATCYPVRLSTRTP
jgi:hypothetical protein